LVLLDITCQFNIKMEELLNNTCIQEINVQCLMFHIWEMLDYMGNKEINF